METTLTLSVGSDDPLGDLESLLDWLRDEPELRRHVRQLTKPPPPGHMGGVTEIVVAAISGGGVLSVLAMSLNTWLSQPRGSDVEIKIRRPDGEEIEVSVQRAADVESLLAKLLEEGQQ